MREVDWLCGKVDAEILGQFMVGLPMLGWAYQGTHMQEKLRMPEITLEQFLEGADARNRKLIERTGPSNDELLDQHAWQKTEEEIQLGILSGPYLNL